MFSIVPLLVFHLHSERARQYKSHLNGVEDMRVQEKKMKKKHNKGTELSSSLCSFLTCSVMDQQKFLNHMIHLIFITNLIAPLFVYEHLCEYKRHTEF